MTTTPGMSECESCKNGKPCYSFSCGAINSREAELIKEHEKSKGKDARIDTLLARFKHRDIALNAQSEEMIRLRSALESSRQEIERLKTGNETLARLLDEFRAELWGAKETRKVLSLNDLDRIKKLKAELEAERQSTRGLLVQIEREIEMNDHGQSCSTIGKNSCDCHLSRLAVLLDRYKAGGRAT